MNRKTARENAFLLLFESACKTDETAEEIFETAKKLTNPAIDFILEVEKIINEQ